MEARAHLQMIYDDYLVKMVILHSDATQLGLCQRRRVIDACSPMERTIPPSKPATLKNLSGIWG
jgi:hypothetical protein